MELFYKELKADENTSGRQGLLITISQAVHQGIAVTLTKQRCVRVAVNDVPYLWIRIEDDFDGYQILRSNRQQHVSALPPILFSLARQCADDHLLWAKTYAEMLANSSGSPFVNGKWFLGQEQYWHKLEPSMLEKIVQQKTYGYVEWEFGKHLYPVALRVFSAPDYGRVKAWQKFVKTAALPPILLYWVSVLDAYVILDGHDRVLAAHLEGVALPVLVLHEMKFWHKTEVEQNKIMAALEKAPFVKGTRFSEVERANRVLQNAFNPGIEMLKTRARLLEGGIEQWKTEVQSEIEKQNIQNARLLDGL
jgi:hypothetical protein